MYKTEREIKTINSLFITYDIVDLVQGIKFLVKSEGKKSKIKADAKLASSASAFLSDFFGIFKFLQFFNERLKGGRFFLLAPTCFLLSGTIICVEDESVQDSQETVCGEVG